MLTTFDIIQSGKELKFDHDSQHRLLEYQQNRYLYDNKFEQAFPETFRKLRKRYRFENTTPQTLIKINMFYVMTEFFKNLMTNEGIKINVDEVFQDQWLQIAHDNNFISVLKEVFIDNSRFGNGLFKVILSKDKPQIFSVSPDIWFPVFDKGNLNSLKGHLLVYHLEDIVNGKEQRLLQVEKHYKGYVLNELWQLKDNIPYKKLDITRELGMAEEDNFSALWNDFILFPVKNTTESDRYFGDSDYKHCKSVVEEMMLTVSQNSKIINRHANPLLTGSEQNLEIDIHTGRKIFPDSDFIQVGQDGIKPEFITADLQAQAIKQHLDILLQFFYMLTKTPPQAYGIDISEQTSGEALRRIYMSALSKIDDIKQVSFANTLEKVVKCAMAFNQTPVDKAQISWGNPVPEDTSEKTTNTKNRVEAGILSKKSAIMQLDHLDEASAQRELEQINQEKSS